MVIRGLPSQVKSGLILATSLVACALCVFDLGRGSRLYSDWYDPNILTGLPLGTNRIFRFSEANDPPSKPWPASPPLSWWKKWWLWEYERRWMLAGAETLVTLATGVVLAARGWIAARRPGSAHGRLRVRTLMALVAYVALATWVLSLGRRSRFYAEKQVECMLKVDRLGGIYGRITPEELVARQAAIRKMKGLAAEYGRAAARPWLTVVPDLD